MPFANVPSSCRTCSGIHGAAHQNADERVEEWTPEQVRGDVPSGVGKAIVAEVLARSRM